LSKATANNDKTINHLGLILLWGGIVLVGIGLGLLAYRGIYNRFWADDWCYNAQIKLRGIFGAIQGYYDVTMYSANRFSLTLFSGLFYHLGIVGVKVLPLLIILIWVGSVFGIVKRIDTFISNSRNHFQQLLIAMVLVYVTLFIAPNQFQILYWRSAVLPYTFPLLFINFILLILANSVISKRNKIVDGILISTLTFLGVGFSEIGGTYILGIVGIILLGLLLSKKKALTNRGNLLTLVIIAFFSGVVAYGIMAASPTNAIRYSMHYYDPPSIIELPFLTLKLTSQLIFNFYKSYFLPLTILTLFGFSIGINQTFSPPLFQKIRFISFGKFIGIFSLVTVGICYCMLVPSAYIEKAVPEEGRALILSTYLLVVFTFIIATSVGRWIGQYILGWKLFRSLSLKIFLLSLFLIFTIYTVRTYTYVLKTIPFYEKRAQVWDERDVTLRTAAKMNQRIVEVREIDSYMGVMELHPDPNWLNYCAADYYGVGEIRSTLPWN